MRLLFTLIYPGAQQRCLSLSRASQCSPKKTVGFNSGEEADLGSQAQKLFFGSLGVEINCRVGDKAACLFFMTFGLQGEREARLSISVTF